MLQRIARTQDARLTHYAAADDGCRHPHHSHDHRAGRERLCGTEDRNLGTNVFQIARTPFAVTDFNIIIKALKYKKIELDDMRAIADKCAACEQVGASASTTVRARYGDNEVQT